MHVCVLKIETYIEYTQYTKVSDDRVIEQNPLTYIKDCTKGRQPGLLSMRASPPSNIERTPSQHTQQHSKIMII